mmetsp:Transcript_23064/g.71927  ORF Transcript_23064/g.71927 Transcript_23064/m.71927 type:complete len:390 (+) Transcript_23064:89-1258(+)
MHGAMGPGGFPEGPQGFGIFEPLGDSMMHAGGQPLNVPGGSRGSKAPKSKKDEEDDEKYTTVMLRNIPNKYTRSMLIEQLHRTGFRGDIDYLYLPTDFANRCNVGYCFVNLRTPLARARFTNAFDGVPAQSCLPGFNSYKVCQVTKAKWQGREENVRRLRSGPELMAQLAAHPEWLPLLLDDEGNQEPFLCEEGVASAHGPPLPRRQTRKKGGQLPLGGPGDAWPLGLNGLIDGLPAGHPGMSDRGGRRRRGGRGLPGPGGYSNLSTASSTYGVPVQSMPVPVMTEHGVQYMPYESYEGSSGYFLAYPTMGGGEQQPYSMPYSAGYPGYPPSYGWSDGGGPGFEQYAAPGAWPPRMPRQQRGRRRGGGNFGDAAVQDVHEDGDGEALQD